MSQNNSSLVGSVFERKSTSHSSPKIFTPAKAGFPAAQHRSKSAFARNLEGVRKNGASRPREAPTITSSAATRPSGSSDPNEWRNQVSRENEQRVASMTDEERERERQEILERFGAGVGDILKKVKLARERQAANGHIDLPTTQDPVNVLEPVPITAREDFVNEVASRRLSSPPPPALSTSSSRPASRADRKLRFAELGPGDVHVYESAPPSPRRKALALPPPSNDGSTISLGKFSGTLAPIPVHAPVPPKIDPDPEEGSAEYIRRRYFPDAPTNDPNLAWMQDSVQPSDDKSASALRFDLSGKPIPPIVSSTLPTHLGLHHHAEGTHAGYTLEDMFLLSRSTVPAQRATMLGVLAKVAQRISAMLKGEIDGMEDIVGKEEELRKRIFAAGAEALSERGSVGARAVEVVWQCVVGWNEEIATIEGVEMDSPSDLAINSIQLDFFLPQVAVLFSQGEILEETKLQLLAVLHRLAQQSNGYAETIVSTPRLVESVVQCLLLMPYAPTGISSLPEPLAIELLITLGSASRKNADALQVSADALLRFITFLPSSSLYPHALATSLLTATLRFYTVLANYGLYSHIATTAVEPLTQLGQYIQSDACTSQTLMAAWLDLLAAWMTCAIDPHKTTPDHEILWSQIIGWGWNSEVHNLEDRLGADERDWPVWAGVWKVHAVWLEGAKVNCVRGGSGERMECLDIIKFGFAEGKERDVVAGCLEAIKQSISELVSLPPGQSNLPHLRAIANYANTLGAVIRLWLASFPPLSDTPLEEPPFPLPFPQITDLCASITVYPSWTLLGSSDKSTRNAYVYVKPLSELLLNYLQLSRRLPSTSKELWAAQAFSILSKLLPGDEESALDIIADICALVMPQWADLLGIQTPPTIWDRGGMSVIKPFVVHSVKPHVDTFIGTSTSMPQTISTVTTLRLPSTTALRTFGLPLSSEWTFAPLNHLLHSGTSEVFKALPVGWDASEVEIGRASLLMTRIRHEILHHYSLKNQVLTREEAVFGCMKVFMLEHGQVQTTDSTEEVFRDQVVGRFMGDVLKSYVVSSPSSVASPSTANLEQVAERFLGPTPFYQYYTDFVALYDAISFSHPLFASLLLPPTSMRYALDYRKHLWNDFGHILKTVQTPVEEVICEDLKEYMWPIEQDPQMISFYLRGLLKQPLQGFVRLIALHHIAASIWSDISTGSSWGEDRATKLLRAVVEQGDHDVVREVVHYQQNITGTILLPPHCFVLSDATTRASRLDFVTNLGLQARLHGLLLAA
ncbi:hypothetical protein H0H93_005125 [Arthromyces matolae]|nr:hypothetical protein H0H93_005125 [Arthromyces matolae]